MITIQNVSRNTVLADKATIADSFVTRMVGLLNRKNLSAGEALVITRCQSIHMLFMRFAIDAIFVDKDDRITGLVPGIKPFMFSQIFFKSRYVIELPTGIIVQSESRLGDQIKIIE